VSLGGRELARDDDRPARARPRPPGPGRPRSPAARWLRPPPTLTLQARATSGGAPEQPRLPQVRARRIVAPSPSPLPSRTHVASRPRNRRSICRGPCDSVCYIYGASKLRRFRLTWALPRRRCSVRNCSICLVGCEVETPRAHYGKRSAATRPHFRNGRQLPPSEARGSPRGGRGRVDAARRRSASCLRYRHDSPLDRRWRARDGALLRLFYERTSNPCVPLVFSLPLLHSA